jgi:SnoaL-like protein
MPSNVAQAKEAIEVVCPGGLDRMEEFYRPDFHDHVNAMEFHGFDGARKSVALYRRLFADPKIVVDKTVSEGDYVATHWKRVAISDAVAQALRSSSDRR